MSGRADAAPGAAGGSDRGSSPIRPTRGQSTLMAIGGVAGSSVASRALRFVKALAVARLLGPESYGVYGALALLVTYAQFLDLGSSLAAFRDLTSALGRGDARGALHATGRMATLKLAGVVLVGAGALAASFWPDVPFPLRQGLIALPLIALSSTLLSQVLLHLQAHARVGDFAYATAMAAVSDLVLCVGLTWAWSLPGLLAATALSPVLVLAWASSRGALARPRAVPPDLLRQYVRTGLPLVALAFLDQSLVSVDQLVVLAYFSLRELGLYNVAIIAPEAVRTLGLAGAAVLGPRLLREYARAGGRVAAIQSHTLLPVRLYAQLLPVPVAVLWIAGSYALARLYPSYVEALQPMQILLVAINFLVVLSGVTTFLFAIDKHPRTLLFLTPAIGLNVAIDIALIRGGWGLAGVATGSLITYFLYAFAQVWYICGHFGLELRERLRFQAAAFGPGVCTGVVLSLVERSVPYRDSLARTAAVCVFTVILLLPFAWRALRTANRIDDSPHA